MLQDAHLLLGEIMALCHRRLGDLNRRNNLKLALVPPNRRRSMPITSPYIADAL
jgi:hypothetical protein